MRRRTMLRRRHERPSEKTLYSVPRRFDIATLLVVSLVYSLLFALLRFVNAPWQVFLFVGLLTVVIGVAQALFPYGNEPRRASLVAGMLYMQVWCFILGFAEGRLTAGLCGAFASVVVGPPVGYFTGVVEAGVFLVADKVRRRWFPADAASDEAETGASTDSDSVGTFGLD